MEIVITQGERIMSGPLAASNNQRLELPGGNTLSGMPFLPYSYRGRDDGTDYMIRKVTRRITQYDRRTQCLGGQVIKIVGEGCEISQVVADKPVEDVRTELVRRVKALAGEKILEIIPIWKQINLTARAAQLARKNELTPEELAEWDAGEAVWNRVAPIRAASDLIEAEINRADPAMLRDLDVEGHEEWPA